MCSNKRGSTKNQEFLYWLASDQWMLFILKEFILFCRMIRAEGRCFEMDIEVEYLWFEIFRGNLIPNNSFSYKLITVRENKLSLAINKPIKEFKVIGVTTV